jgi:hypothetical protein
VADATSHRVVRFTPPFATDMAADCVLGQADFTSGDSNHSGFGDPEGDQSLNYPYAVVSTGVELLVGDYYNNRVMVWNTLPVTDDEPATLVLGQPDFTTGGGGGVGQANLRAPNGVECDGSAIYVTDSINHRIVIWDSVPLPGDHGRPADRIIGQPQWDTRVANWEGVTARSLMTFIFDGTDTCMSPVIIGGTTLWGVDPGNNRLLRYDLTP